MFIPSRPPGRAARVLLTACMAVAATQACAATTVYRSVAADGSVSYADSPTPGAFALELPPETSGVVPMAAASPGFPGPAPGPTAADLDQQARRTSLAGELAAAQAALDAARRTLAEERDRPETYMAPVQGPNGRVRMITVGRAYGRYSEKIERLESEVAQRESVVADINRQMGALTAARR